MELRRSFLSKTDELQQVFHRKERQSTTPCWSEVRLQLLLIHSETRRYRFQTSSTLSCPQLHSGSSEAEEENDPDGAFAFRRKAGCQYYAVSVNQPNPPPFCHSQERYWAKQDTMNK